MKRAVDLVFGSVALLLSFPVMVVTAIVLRKSVGSPVIFTQQRPGLNGRPFHIYKFRTMTDERDEHQQLLPDNERLTRAGRVVRKLSLDELPQLFNVVKGELSFVGPRPLLMEYLPLYTSEQARRHEVKPGITGWAQVNGRNAISWEQKFKLDVWYVEHHSFWLDIKILFLTVLKVLKVDGINQQGQATIEKFKGSSASELQACTSQPTKES
ncbi:sugar transferase [Bacillus horti]|uniref:Sugar transferase EpsL n=1 Tax=Caldalkalibacillus horti TaxID=77523 RepID=A0ABT9VZE4_9BACI|nr:sugar transferase [Bacillus horti]MDQ0166374.1 sugar transferase EpsL [Bacillus horti]